MIIMIMDGEKKKRELLISCRVYGDCFISHMTCWVKKKFGIEFKF